MKTFLSGGVMKFDDLNFEKERYSAMKAYQQSKLANVLFTSELARRIKGKKSSVYQFEFIVVLF